MIVDVDDPYDILDKAIAYSRQRLKKGVGYLTAEDVAQEICAAFLAARPTHPGTQLAIMRNKVVDAIRERYRDKIETVEEFPDQAIGNEPEEHAIRADLRARLDTALAALPAKERRVVALRFLAGYTTPEIGQLLNLSTGNVRIIQLRALRVLRTATAALEGHSRG